MSKLLIVLPAPDDRRYRATGSFPVISAGANKLLTGSLKEVGCDSYEIITVFSRPTKLTDTFFLAEGEAYKRCRVSPESLRDLNTLAARIKAKKPNAVLALGDIPMWALTEGCTVVSRKNGDKIPRPTGCAKYRGSILDSSEVPIKLIIGLDPHVLFRQWYNRPVFRRDLQRAWEQAQTAESTKPIRDYIVRPTFDQAMDYLNFVYETVQEKPTDVSCDIETRLGHTACIGLCVDLKAALCIPFMCDERRPGYWPPDEEVALTLRLRDILLHPNTCLVGQNWAYDAQYFHADFCYIPVVGFDTMLAQNVLFPGQPKRLDFIASMYAKWYRFWKDDGKEWRTTMEEENLWRYNCDDVFYTLECAWALRRGLKAFGLTDQMQFKQDLWKPVFDMSLRGMRTDAARRQELHDELTAAIDKRRAYIEAVLGHPFNPSSTPKMKALFNYDLALKPIISQKTGKVSFDNETLPGYCMQEPLLEPLIKSINEMRSLRVFLSTFIDTKLAPDLRIRGMFNVAGTETTRFSCRKDGFGNGHNLMNIPEGNED